MSLNDYVNVAISATGPGPSAPGFGTGLLASYHVVGGSRRVLGPYTGADGVLADFSNVSIGGNANAASQHTYKAALKYFAQTPKPQLLYIGRRAFPYTQLVDLTPVAVVAGTAYQFQIGGLNGVGGTPVAYTVPANKVGATASISAGAGVNTVTDSAVTWTAADAGKTFVVSGSSHSANNGSFTILAYTSAHVVTYTCASGVTDAGANISTVTSANVATTSTELAALLNTATVGAGPVAGFVADGTSGTHVRCTTAVAGRLVEFQVQVPASICRVREATGADTSIAGELAADLSAIWSENKNWYGLGLDSQSDVEVESAATFVEANGNLIFAASTSDSDAADSNVTNDVLSYLKTNSVTRTAGMFNQYSNLSFGSFAWLASRLTQTPGSDTWHFNTLALVQADSDQLVPEASVLAVQAKNGTVYTTLGDLNLTQGGTSGGGEWMDQTRFLDWLRVTIQLAMIALMARNVGKIPYDDTGIATIEQALKVCLEQGVTNGGFVAGSYVVTPPSVSGISTANKTARNLPALPWTAKLAGAIHRMTINGTTSVA